MKIALLGTRGIPANYGGFETFAEELSVRLAERGHEVTVYGRSNKIRHPSRMYRGVRLVILPTIPTKHLDTVAHTLVSVAHALSQDFDVILMCNAANAAFTAVPRLAGVPVALNVDGIERKRRKWGPLARAYYWLSERLATVLPTAIVTDASVIRDYFVAEHGTASTMIAYGAPSGRSPTTAFIHSLGLKERSYLLYVSRLEPENNADLVIDAYRQVRTSWPLVIVGDAPYAADYIRRLRSKADSRVQFTGAIYGPRCFELRSHAYAYVQATEVGGAHPALLEAMGAGNCILAKDAPEHREVLGPAGLYFNDAGDLAALIRRILADPEQAARYRVKAQARAERLYSWDRITDQYEGLLAALVNESVRRR